MVILPRPLFKISRISTSKLWNGPPCGWSSDPQGKGRLIPAQAFEHERNFLFELPLHLPAPYQIHERSIDQYGYVAFDANYYWAPEPLHGELTVLEYDQHLVLCQGRQRLIDYPLAPDGVRGQIFAPKDAPPPARPTL